VFSLPPLSPNKVTATRELFVRQDLILRHEPTRLTQRQFLSVLTLISLTVKLLLLLATPVPPSASANNLAHRRVVVAFADIESESLGRRLWLHVCVLVVQYLVQLYQQLLIDRMQEVWLLEGVGVKDTAVAPRDWDQEELKELY